MNNSNENVRIKRTHSEGDDDCMENYVSKFTGFLEKDKKLSDNTLQSYRRDIEQYMAYVKANNGEKRELFFLLKNADFSNTTISLKSDLETTISNLEELILRINALYESTTDTFTKIILKSTIEAIPEIIDDAKESLEKAK